MVTLFLEEHKTQQHNRSINIVRELLYNIAILTACILIRNNCIEDTVCKFPQNIYTRYFKRNHLANAGTLLYNSADFHELPFWTLATIPTVLCQISYRISSLSASGYIVVLHVCKMLGL